MKMLQADFIKILLNILGKVAELKDRDTEQHLERVAMIVKNIAVCLSGDPKLNLYLSSKYIECLKLSSSLHDIGKIAIPDKILLKPDVLSFDEFEIIKAHTIIGGEILEEARRKIGKGTLLDMAIVIARHHHERWDGIGYPDGLKKKEIPLSARIMAVADVYDALVSRRPYKEPINHIEAIKIIRKEKGRQFDPDIVDIILQNQEVFFTSIKYQKEDNASDEVKDMYIV